MKLLYKLFHVPAIIYQNRKMRRALVSIRSVAYPNGVIRPGEALDAICDDCEEIIGPDDQYKNPKITRHRFLDSVLTEAHDALRGNASPRERNNARAAIEDYAPRLFPAGPPQNTKTGAQQ